MIIATLPPLYRESLVEHIASHPMIGIIRYNTGMDASKPPLEIVRELRELADKFGKRLWIDLKCAQPRIVNWATPNYGKIELSREIEVDGDARVHFRGDGWTDLRLADGNLIYVDPPPPRAIGRGQAVNIVGETVNILRTKGFLTPLDREYLTAACDYEVNALLLSFVEYAADVAEVQKLLEGQAYQPMLGLKIETAKGLAFAREYFMSGQSTFGTFPIVARDDLTNEIGGLAVMQATQELLNGYSRPIVASRFFPELCSSGTVGPADYSDWHWLHQLGYKVFMLQDELCLNPETFDSAMTVIAAYVSRQKED